MAKLLEGKVIAITGAGGGLGRAYALDMAKEGAKLVINDLGGTLEGSGGESSMADRVVEEIKALGGEAVANYDSVATMEGGENIVAAAVEAFGRLDGLVNNAGILRDKTLLKMTEEAWDPVIAVHLKGTFSCTLAAAKQLKAQGDGGVIVNTTSYAGLKGNFGQTNYAAAKAGIYAMTLVHAMELRRAGIRVNAIAPMAKTRMTDDIDLIPDSMTVEHVAPMAVFLLSDLAEDVTGRVFGVHGAHAFEYKMEMTQGVDRGALWAPTEIAERLAEIAGEAPPAPAAEPAPAAALPAGAPETPQDQIKAIFQYMPDGFLPDKAGGWQGVLHWEIAGTGDFTITVADGACTSAEGKEGAATCVVKTDTDTFLGIVDGSVDGNQAFMQGKISATNVGDLMKYQKVIDQKKAQAAFEAAQASAAPAAAPADAAAAAAPAPAAAPASPQEHVRSIFRFMPEGFQADKAGTWKGVIVWDIAGSGEFTISVADGKCTSAEGKQGKPTCVVKTDTDTIIGIVEGTVDGNQAYMQGKISATNVGDLMKYQKVIDGKKARAAYEASLAAAPAAAPVAAPAAAAPAAPAAPPEPKGPSAGEKALAAMHPLPRLKLLLGLLPELKPADGLDAATLHLTTRGAACTLTLADGKLDIAVGHQGEPTSRIVASAGGLWDLLAGEDPKALLADAKVTATSMQELRWLVATCGPDAVKALADELESRGTGIDRKLLGKQYHGDPVFVTREVMLAYAEATNDDNPRFVDLDRAGGIVAPPMLPVRYFNQSFFTVFMDPELQLDLSRLLFGEMALWFKAPLREKDLVVVKSVIDDIIDKDTGQILNVRSRLMCEGEVKAEGLASLFIRWQSKGKIKRLAAPKGASPKPDVAWEEPMVTREDQTVLWSEAGQDPNPIHLDEGFAKAAGLPGRILHGLCSMSFTGKALVDRACGGDPSGLTYLKVRFSKPAQPGQTITTRAFAPEEEGGEKVWTFEAVNDEGVKTITGGVARTR